MVQSIFSIFKFKNKFDLNNLSDSYWVYLRSCLSISLLSIQRFVSLQDLTLTLKLRVARHIECVGRMSGVTLSGWSTVLPVLSRVWRMVHGVCVAPARRRTCGGCYCCCSYGRSAAGWGKVGTVEAVGRNCHCYGGYCSYLIRKSKNIICFMGFKLNLMHSNTTLFLNR